MAGSDRVAFTTISNTVSSSAFGSSTLMGKAVGDKSSNGSGKKKPSFRLEVDLFEPDADSFPEYNFRQLLLVEKKKHKRKEKKGNGLPGPAGLDHLEDPLGGDDDDDVARLAREMEEKYGSGSAYSKSVTKRGAVEHFDKGLGYDENDSFIDNTDAYDELIPDEIEPNHGGFYINSGLLEFHNRPNFERPEDAERMPKARKRTLSTSSEDEEERRVDGEKKTEDGDRNPKKKKKKASLEKKSGKSKGVKEKEPQKESGGAIKTTTVKEMLRLKRDNHRNNNKTDGSSGSSSSSASDDEEDEEEKNLLSAEDVEEEEEDESDDVEEMDTASPKSKPNGAPPPAPNALPVDCSKELCANLIIMEQSAGLLTGPGENVLTNRASLDVLLAIEQETQLPAKPPQFRQQIYSYLAERLKCRREDLMAKAEEMRGHAEEAKARKLLLKLKKVVEGRMAKLLETYEAECRRVTEMKSTMHVIGLPEHQQMQMPRRKFQWTDSSRKLLYEVYEAARSSHALALSKKVARAKTVEEFLKQDVLPLWPTGWMKYEELAKEVDRRRALLEKQTMIKDVLNSTAWNAEGPERRPEETGGVTVSAVNGSHHGVSSVIVNGGGGEQKQQQVKKNSYDYSITNLIGNNHQNSSNNGAEAGQTESKSPASHGGVLKVKSVSSLNSSTPPAATVIVSSDNEIEMVGKDHSRPRINKPQQQQQQPAGSNQAAAQVRTKRQSDSDSSCEIVNVYREEEKGTASVLVQNNNNNNNSRKNGGNEDSTVARPGSASSGRAGGGGQPMDANDIDVNQIMQDLKERSC